MWGTGYYNSQNWKSLRALTLEERYTAQREHSVINVHILWKMENAYVFTCEKRLCVHIYSGKWKNAYVFICEKRQCVHIYSGKRKHAYVFIWKTECERTPGEKRILIQKYMNIN